MKKHIVSYNALGQPIYYYTVTGKELEEWSKHQTQEQKRLTTWLEKVVNK